SVDGQRDGDNRSIAPLQRFRPPLSKSRIDQGIADDLALRGPDACAGRPETTSGVGPRDMDCCKVTLVDARLGNSRHPLLRIMFGASDPAKAIAAHIDDDLTHLVQPVRLVARADQGLVAQAERAQRPIQPDEFLFRGGYHLGPPTLVMCQMSLAYSATVRSL